jgi:hypothetical protein
VLAVAAGHRGPAGRAGFSGGKDAAARLMRGEGFSLQSPAKVLEGRQHPDRAAQFGHLTHSPELHAHQARGFSGTTLAKAARKLDELAATLVRGKTRRPRARVAAEIGKITHDLWGAANTAGSCGAVDLAFDRPAVTLRSSPRARWR